MSMQVIWLAFCSVFMRWLMHVSLDTIQLFDGSNIYTRWYHSDYRKEHWSNGRTNEIPLIRMSKWIFVFVAKAFNTKDSNLIHSQLLCSLISRTCIIPLSFFALVSAFLFLFYILAHTLLWPFIGKYKYVEIHNIQLNNIAHCSYYI